LNEGGHVHIDLDDNDQIKLIFKEETISA